MRLRSSLGKGRNRIEKTGKGLEIWIEASFFLAVGLLIFIRPINNLDEIWNFSFAWNCGRGLASYRDFNMVQTPASGYLASIGLGILGQELWVFRLAGALLCGGILNLTWRIYGLKLENKRKAYLFCLIQTVLSGSYFTYDYNFLNLFLILSVLLCEIKGRKTEGEKGIRNRFSWLIGLLCGLTCLVKQNVGLLVCLACVTAALSCYGGRRRRELLLRLWGMCLPLLLFIFWMWGTGSFDAFWDDCIAGVGSFTNRITVLDFLRSGPLAAILVAAAAGYAAYCCFRCVRPAQEDRKGSGVQGSVARRLFLIYGLASCSLVYPIFDGIHFWIGFFPLLILMFLDLDQVTYIRSGREALVGMLILWGSIGLLACRPIWGLDLKACGLTHFRNVPITKETEAQVREIDDFLLGEMSRGREVYVLDASAALYLIPLDVYHKDYDLLLYGNTGTKSAEDLIEQLPEAEVTVLVRGEGYGVNWQFPDQIRGMIRDNWKYRDSVGPFDIFER